MCRCAFAADGYGGIAGTVREAGGDPAPLAHVSVICPETRIHREVVAGPKGEFRAPQVPAGACTVTAQSVRSGASARIAAVVRAGRNTEVSIDLSPGWTAAELKDPRDAIPAGANVLHALRNISEITRGQAGGNIEGYTPYSPRSNSAFNSVGQRGQDNNFLVDGLDNNESWLRGAVLEVPVETIASVSLLEVYLPPSIGHAAGGSVNVRSRSGSGQFHGSGYEYFQSSALSARNFFDGPAKPGLLGNRFGGTVGGPVRKNSWFFFANAEAMRERRGLTVISTVPTTAQKEGDFGSSAIYDPDAFRQIGDGLFTRQPFPGNRIPSNRIPAAARNVVSLYPDPNLPGAANNYRFAPDRIQNSEWFSLRSDKIVNSRSTLLTRLSYEHHDQLSPGALPGLPFSGSDSSQHADSARTSLSAWGGGISHTFLLRPALVNEFRAGITRFDLSGRASDRSVDASAALAIPGLGRDGLPAISAAGFAQLGAAQAVPMQIRTTSYQFEDAVQWRTPRHTWAFGVQAIRRHADGDTPEWTTRGAFSFTPDYTSLPGVALTGNSIASLLTGYPNEVRRDMQLAPFQVRGWEYAAFVQDEVRIWPRLTLQGGLRYSLDPPVTEAQNRMVNFSFDRAAPALNQYAAKNGVNRYGGLSFNKRTFAPRIGFAYDVFGNGATVLRGGFSKAYDAGAYVAQSILAQNPPFASRLDQINSTFQTGSRLAGGLPPLENSDGTIYAIEHRDYTPYADQWGLFLQQRLRRRLSLEIAGSGSMGIHLYESYDANQPYPAPTPYNYPRYPYEPYHSRIEYLGFAGGSTYYGGQVKVTEQRDDLQLIATYRFAKSLDDSTPPGTNQESRPAFPQYIYNLRGNRSPSPFDITQRLVLTAWYDLPFRKGRAAGVNSRALRMILSDWRAGTVITVQSGFPFTPELAVNSLNNGGYQLPDRRGDGALPSSQRSYLRWFNTSLDPADPNRAFDIPALYQYGNSGFGIVRGPGLATVDASLGRSFSLTERLRLHTRVDASNLLNRANFALPNRILGVESSGMISHTSTLARSLELRAKMEW